jgi:hypothetical protein
MTKRAATPTNDTQCDPAVEAFMEALVHPRRAEVETLRRIVLGASPAVREGIKWNVPSFRTTEYFATFHLRAKGADDRVRLIFHTGAKVKASATEGVAVADPTGLLSWLAKDRASVTFEGAADIAAKREALEALVRAWVARL